MHLSPQHVARHTNSQSMWIFFSSLEPPIWRQEWAQLWGLKGQEAMWLLGWAEATVIAPTSLSAKHKQPIWLPASSGLQETPSQQLLPSPGKLGSSLQRKFSQVRPAPFPQPQSHPPQLFYSTPGQESPKAPTQGPWGYAAIGVAPLIGDSLVHIWPTSINQGGVGW